MRFDSLEDALTGLYGPDREVLNRRRVFGGDINESSVLTLSGGLEVFLKENSAPLPDMFPAEAAGLEALGSVRALTHSPLVPEPLAWGKGEGGYFLLLGYIRTQSSASRVSGEQFGRSLASLHRAGRHDRCGFHGDNRIGLSPQPNPFTESWHDFFAENRLLYQWRMARDKGFGSSGMDRKMERLAAGLPGLIPDMDEGRPSLLHGDLWGGNWIADETGNVYLIDPAVYYGHREADLAMTELFGGFPPGFHAAYRDEWPLEAGFAGRKDIYNLYHLLNHLNLFGASYYGGTAEIIGRYG